MQLAGLENNEFERRSIIKIIESNTWPEIILYYSTCNSVSFVLGFFFIEKKKNHLFLARNGILFSSSNSFSFYLSLHSTHLISFTQKLMFR